LFLFTVGNSCLGKKEYKHTGVSSTAQEYTVHFAASTLLAQFFHLFWVCKQPQTGDLKKMSMIAGIIVSVSLATTWCVGISKLSMKLLLKLNKFHIQSQIICELYAQTEFDLGELIERVENRSGSQYAQQFVS
jgi:hypothetical protein